MFCMNCGRELPEEARFCRYCGTKTTLEEEMPGGAPKRKPEDEPQPAPESAESEVTPAAVDEQEHIDGQQPASSNEQQPDISDETLFFAAGELQPDRPGESQPPQTDESELGFTDELRQPQVNGPQAQGGPRPRHVMNGPQQKPQGGKYPDVPQILQPEKKKPYIPPIMPPMVTDSPKGTIFRLGHARDVERITQVGVELAGLGTVVLLIRMILLAFISWKQSLSDVAYKGLSNDKSVIFTVLLSFIFLLATCILSGKTNKYLWLGFFPPGLLLIDCVVETIKTSSSYPSDYYGYNVGWSVYKEQILVYGGLMLVYLFLFMQRNNRSRSGAVLLAFASLLAMGLFIWDAKDTAFIAVKISDAKMAWYELFTGISHICFFMPYFALAIRELLAEKGEE